MNGLEKLLNQEEQRLKEIMQEVDGRLHDAPEGTLRITSTGKSPQFMLCTGESAKSIKRGKYIRKCDADIIRKLAQKAYDRKIKKLAERRLKQLKMLIREYRDTEIDTSYESLGDVRKSLITPVEPVWEQKAAQWKAAPYQPKEFAEGTPEIYSKRGERVRSKSEKIIADTLGDAGIEYKYECPLTLKGYGTVYPDFTILSRRTGEEIYWEHDGRMDDPQYAEKAVKKIDTYIRNGIFPGDRLILSYETSNYILSDKTIHALIRKHLL